MDADDKEIGHSRRPAADTKAPGYAVFKIPPGTTRFTLRVARGAVRLYGAEFRRRFARRDLLEPRDQRRERHVAFPGRSTSIHWAAELRHYKPDLVIVNYGTNESGFANFVDTTLGT